MTSSFRLRWIGAIAVAALFSVLWCKIISPVPAWPHFFEVELTTETAAKVQIYFDRGLGFTETESSSDVVQPTADFKTIRLPLPPGKYRSLFFDPTKSGPSARFRHARIATFDGRTVRQFSIDELSPTRSRRHGGDGENSFQPATTASPAPLTPTVVFEPVLRLNLGFWSKVSLLWLRWFKAVGLSLTTVLLVQTVWLRRFQLRSELPAFSIRRPRTTLAVCAAIAAVISSYPVVFFGKSFVSPTSGVRLLYQKSPTLPGYTDLYVEDTRGADVGAMAWAHQPYTVVEGRAVLQEHTLPLWNRFNSCGVTLLGQGQSMFGDPLHFFVMLAGGNAWALDIKFVLCKAIFSLGLGWCVWLLTRDLAASGIVVFAGAFFAFFNYRVNHPAIFSVSYAPWILAAWLEMIFAQDSRVLSKAIALWFGAGWCLINSGTVKEAYLLFGALNVTGALAFLLSPTSFKWKRHQAGPIIVGIIALGLATAPAWWTFFDALSHARTTYDTPFVLQNPRGWLIGLFDDLFYLEEHPGRPVFAPAANFLILLGCLWAVAKIRLLVVNRVILALLIGFLAAIAVGFAWAPAAWFLKTPFLRNIYFLNNHFSCIAIVHAGVLAGWGFAVARRELVSKRAGRSIFTMAVLFSGMLLAYFVSRPGLWTNGRGFAGWQELLPYHAFLYVNVLLLPLALVWLTIAAARHLQGRRMTVGVFLLSLLATIIILGRHGQHLAPGFPTDHFITVPGSRADLLVRSPATDFLVSETAVTPGRVMGTQDTLFPGFMSVYGLESINGPDAIIDGQQRDLLDASALTPSMGWRFSLMPQSASISRPLLDFFNVRYVATPPGTTLDGDDYERVASLNLDIYRSETAWPRAFFTDRLESYENVADLLAQLKNHPAGRPFAAIQKGDTSAPPPSDERETPPIVAAATDYQLTNNTTAFTVSTPGPGFIILHENWLADDFRVTLDGNSVPYFRVNHAFKGIAVTAGGTHRVAFSYWPRRLTAALILGGIGFLIFTVLLLFLRRKKTSASETAFAQV